MSMQFETDYVVESTLVMNEELYAAKYKDKLEPSYKVMMLTGLILFIYSCRINILYEPMYMAKWVGRLMGLRRTGNFGSGLNVFCQPQTLFGQKSKLFYI